MNIYSTSSNPIEVKNFKTCGEINLIVRHNEHVIVFKNGKRITSKPLGSGAYHLNSSKTQFFSKLQDCLAGADYINIVVIYVKTGVCYTSGFTAHVTNDQRFPNLVINEEITCSYAISIEDPDKVINTFVNNYQTYSTILTDINNLIRPLLEEAVSDEIISSPKKTRSMIAKSVINHVDLSRYGVKLKSFTIDTRNIAEQDRWIINAINCPNTLMGIRLIDNNVGNTPNNNGARNPLNINDLFAYKMFDQIFNQNHGNFTPAVQPTNNFSFLNPKCPSCGHQLNGHLSCPNCDFKI